MQASRFVVPSGPFPRHLEALVAAQMRTFGRRFIALMDAVRRAVRRAMEDPEFGAVFAQDTILTVR